jgi:hypothetical protein
MTKAETLVNGAKPEPRSLAIEPQILAMQTARALNGPLKHRRGNPASRECSSNRKAMNERRLLLVNVRPEHFVLELKFYRARGFSIRLRKME